MFSGSEAARKEIQLLRERNWADHRTVDLRLLVSTYGEKSQMFATASVQVSLDYFQRVAQPKGWTAKGMTMFV